jgi:hypothetical protein
VPVERAGGFALIVGWRGDHDEVCAGTFDEPIDFAQQMIVGNMRLQAKAIE